jgi:hypothetical protein
MVIINAEDVYLILNLEYGKKLGNLKNKIQKETFKKIFNNVF